MEKAEQVLKSQAQEVRQKGNTSERRSRGW